MTRITWCTVLPRSPLSMEPHNIVHGRSVLQVAFGHRLVNKADLNCETDIDI